MKRTTQGLLLGFVGAVLLRLALTDAYLRYVNDWMKWPIVASGVLLLGLALGPLFSRRDEHDPGEGHEAGDGHGSHGVPAVTWLLVLPGLVAFVISPPALGSFLAERRIDSTVSAPKPAVVADLDDDTPLLAVEEFIWRVDELPESLVDRPVSMTGFVSYGKEGWYVTRMSISCCAADATAYRVLVEEADQPARDTWVSVTGVWVEGTGGRSSPAITATEVVEVEPPAQTYQ